MAKKKRSIKAKGRVKRRPQAKTKKKSTRKRVGARRKPTKRKAVARKRKPAKRKTTRKRRPATGRKLVKQVEKRSTERVMAGRRRRKRSNKKRRVVMAGTKRRRKVGALGGNGMLIGLGIGALAIYLLTKKSTSVQRTDLPPIIPTSNQTRNTQSSDLINYAIAGGLAIDAIIKLIDRLNSSSDQEVENIYDRVNTTGDLSVYV